MSSSSPVLEVCKLAAGYGGRPVVHEVSITVHGGEVVALVGANGAGKTTTLLATAGELDALAGEVRIAGVATKAPLHKRARGGMAYVTEERSIFRGLTARENLVCAGVAPGKATVIFPELERLMDVRAGLLSGGEQQMLTLARALARRPNLLLADELSLGLAPIVVDRLLRTVRQAADERSAGVLIVEQHVRKALDYVDRVYVMRGGRIELELRAGEARERLQEIQALYFASATPVHQ